MVDFAASSQLLGNEWRPKAILAWDVTPQTVLDLVPTNHLAKWDNCRPAELLWLSSPHCSAQQSGVTPHLDQSVVLGPFRNPG